MEVHVSPGCHTDLSGVSVVQLESRNLHPKKVKCMVVTKISRCHLTEWKDLCAA